MLRRAIWGSADPRGGNLCRVQSFPASYGNPFQYCLRSSALIGWNGRLFRTIKLVVYWLAETVARFRDLPSVIDFARIVGNP